MPTATTEPKPVPVALYQIGPNNSEPILISIGTEPVLAGRSSGTPKAPNKNMIHLTSLVVSRKHALLWSEGTSIFVRDTSSSSGTFINGERLPPNLPGGTPIHSNDILRFGEDLEIGGVIHSSQAFKIEYPRSEDLLPAHLDAQMVREISKISQSTFESTWNILVSHAFDTLVSSISDLTTSSSIIRSMIDP